MLAGARRSPALVHKASIAPCHKAQSHHQAAVGAAPSMSVRRFNQSVVRRLHKRTVSQQPVLGDPWTGLQKQSRGLHSAPSAQPATQTAVQQLSQWWEHQWHQQQEPVEQQKLHYVQHLARQQQQQQQQNVMLHQQNVSAGAEKQHPMRAARSKRRKGSPNIIPPAHTTSSTYGSPISLEATDKFKSLLASGDRYRKMSTAAELLKQAQQLHNLQVQHLVKSLQEPAQFSAQQQLLQRHHDLHQAPSRQQQSVGRTHQCEAGMHLHETAPRQQQQQPGRPDHAAAAEHDMASVALDIVESQLPQWSNRNFLDWSAQQDLSIYQPQMQLQSAPSGGLPILTKFTIEERGEHIEVQPLWVIVHQETPDGIARLYETVHTLCPEVLPHISATVEPFCITEKNSMTFSRPQFSHGPWKGYLVGAVGDVAAHQDDALWPNRLFCQKRVMHNVRHGWDIAKFLAEPRIEDVAGHHTNLKLLQEDRQYQPGWVWRMLCSRWGQDAVATYADTKRQMVQEASHLVPAQSMLPRQLQHA